MNKILGFIILLSISSVTFAASGACPLNNQWSRTKAGDWVLDAKATANGWVVTGVSFDKNYKSVPPYTPLQANVFTSGSVECVYGYDSQEEDRLTATNYRQADIDNLPTPPFIKIAGTETSYCVTQSGSSRSCQWDWK